MFFAVFEFLVTVSFAFLAGVYEFYTFDSESEHGNRMLILQAMMTHRRDQLAVISRLGEDLAKEIYDAAPEKIDDDCVFYIRLDKQKAVCGTYAVAHHGDVISITGKVASNPARPEIAVRNLREILRSQFPNLPQEEPQAQS